MRARPSCFLLLLLAGCGGNAAPREDPEPPPADPGALTTPIRIGEELRDELRAQNDAAKARRAEMERMLEPR